MNRKEQRDIEKWVFNCKPFLFLLNRISRTVSSVQCLDAFLIHLPQNSILIFISLFLFFQKGLTKYFLFWSIIIITDFTKRNALYRIMYIWNFSEFFLPFICIKRCFKGKTKIIVYLIFFSVSSLWSLLQFFFLC